MIISWSWDMLIQGKSGNTYFSFQKKISVGFFPAQDF